MLCALVVPFVVVAIGLAWYNAARFGSPFDFGASRNLAGNNMQLRGTVPARLVDGLFLYLLQPAHASTVFPFLLPADAATTYLGATIIEPLAGGVLATMPFFWVLALCPRLRTKRPIVFASVVFLVAAAIVTCCFDIQASGVLGRYYQDFCLYLAVAAGLTALALCEGEASVAEERSALPTSAKAVIDGPAPAPAAPVRIMLFAAAVAATVFFVMLAFFLSFDNAACNTMAGSDPATWEYLRQTFSWWL